MVLLDSDRISPVPPYSGYPLGTKSILPTGLSPSLVHLSRCVLLSIWCPLCGSYNPKNAVTSLVWAVPRSLATTYGITIVFFSYGYLDVSVPRVRFPDVTSGMTGLQPAGLPHSEISGLKVICTSPKLIAACHVLHRLWEPRHPPYALSNFLNLFLGALAPAKIVIAFFPVCQWTLLRKYSPQTSFEVDLVSDYCISLSIMKPLVSSALSAANFKPQSISLWTW